MEAASVLSRCSSSSSVTHRSSSRGTKLLLSNGPRRCCSPSSLLLNPIASSRSAGGSNLALAIGDNCNILSQPRVKKSISGKRCTVMRWGGGQDNDSGEERPETLFMRELAKRKKLGQDVGTKETDTKTKETEKSDSASRKPKATDERDTADQRKRSMALNSEGLDGLVPRGQELVKLGGSFWLSLWPLIAASLLAFAAAYLYFGSAFLHSGNRTSPPPYVDPYQLLESEQLPSQVGPNRVPYNTYRSPQ